MYGSLVKKNHTHTTPPLCPRTARALLAVSRELVSQLNARDCREHGGVRGASGRGFRTVLYTGAELQDWVVYRGRGWKAALYTGRGGASGQSCIWGRGWNALLYPGRGGAWTPALETSLILNFRWLQWTDSGSLPPHTNTQCRESEDCSPARTPRFQRVTVKFRLLCSGGEKLKWLRSHYFNPNSDFFPLLSSLPAGLLKWQLH